jgi:hypothetical protein
MCTFWISQLLKCFWQKNVLLVDFHIPMQNIVIFKKVIIHMSRKLKIFYIYDQILSLKE